MKITLYHYWRSSASWRVRFALAIKNIAYESIAVNLLANEEKRPDFLSKSPTGYVPCLLADGQAIGESVAIIEWLEENFPSPALLPSDSLARARTRQFAEMVNSGIQPLVNLDIVRKVSSEPAEQMKWSAHWIRKGLGACENFLALHRPDGAKFCLGNELGLADIFLIPQCYSAGRNEVNLADFPIIASIYEVAKKTEAYQKSCPETFEPKSA